MALYTCNEPMEANTSRANGDSNSREEMEEDSNLALPPPEPPPNTETPQTTADTIMYPCLICERTFKSKTWQTRHRETAHPGVAPPRGTTENPEGSEQTTDSENTLQCALCSFVPKSKGGLTNHRRVQHPNVTPRQLYPMSAIVHLKKGREASGVRKDRRTQLPPKNRECDHTTKSRGESTTHHKQEHRTRDIAVALGKRQGPLATEGARRKQAQMRPRFRKQIG
ncbi:hypothetical protein, unlikely [Trypanosoma brucei gambiense DAL972]|uniref:C2H2-type domain-containing protein n=1 Tax=Trypanosoma brucei gambiense (strain MHOM/CI/86/DAL972) TaxID=679716 RepID=C9ZIJ9_TRYB9|nr:hypothetical protein, unlikely [Trypanosoma brucei gambiense DAL972]CBH08991.1 hypothetical protein, unlikely [Trypanosoma brucei gambiense DAL972]|eukprot:XP_011771432.1 hypothetical protein, unlikely [Trypanosoma brucei gambiense DAL972]